MLKQPVTQKKSELKSISDISGKNKMLRMYSKIAMLNILKTSLSLKMSNFYIANDRIIMFLPHCYSIY